MKKQEVEKKQETTEIEWDVFRNKKHIATIETTSEEDAIERAINDYHYENFGEAGAMTDSQVSRADKFEGGVFTAKKTK